MNSTTSNMTTVPFPDGDTPPTEPVSKPSAPPLPVQPNPVVTKPIIKVYPADSPFGVCPVIASFQHEKDDVPLAEKKAQIKDELMTSFILAHPSLTLWEYFKLENKKDIDNFGLLPVHEQRKRMIVGLLDFATNTVIDIAKFAVAAFIWIVKTFRHPVVGYLEIRDFFMEFKENCVLLAKMFKKDPKTTGKNLAGGFLLNIKHHPEEFTAESVLLITGGVAVIHGLIDTVKVVFAGVSSTVTATIMSVLMFIHAIDDPILIVMPILKRAVGTAQAVQGDTNDRNSAINYEPLPPLPTCKIPPLYRVSFSTRDLCIARVERVRLALFGTSKRLAQMTELERVDAYKRMHDVICCYLPTNAFEVSVPKMENGMPTGEMVNEAVMMQNCDQLQAKYPPNAPVSLTSDR
ncbi:hypothetical protein ABG067_007212 [Albugo candida]